MHAEQSQGVYSVVLDKSKQDILKLDIVKEIQKMDIPEFGNIKVTIREGRVTNYSVERTVKVE